MKRRLAGTLGRWIGCVVLASAPGLLVATGTAHAATSAPARGEVWFVQAVPGRQVDVTIDGRAVGSGAVDARAVVGPLMLSPGSHAVRLTDASTGQAMEAKLAVKAGARMDLVLHRPASPQGKDVVSVYTTPGSAIGPGKARVLVAHTALVPPADVLVDGKVVFSNIANGEFASADVPEGTLRVELTPTGMDKTAILGPLDLKVAGGKATMVYAVGSPKNGSMDVITHVVDLSSNGSRAPASVRTGSAGLAAGVPVHPFGSATPGSGRSAPGSLGGWTLGGAALLGLVGVGLARFAREQWVRADRVPR